MIPDRLPWRLRARPSATLHEIQVRSTNKGQSELVLLMIQTERSGVKGKFAKTAIPQPEGSEERYPSVLLDLGVGEKAEEIRMTL